jgi:hypothetical protein
MKNFTLITSALLAMTTLAACEQGSDEANLGTGLRALSAVSDGNVAGFDYFIAPCGEALPELGHFEALRNQTLPGTLIEVLDDPFADGSNHRFADYFKTLAAGCYTVKAVPVYGEGGIMKPYTSCTSATRDVQVSEGTTSEVILISQCLGTDPGALDAVAALNHDPEVLDVNFPESKFSCGETIKICASATDSDNDPLEYVVTFPEEAPCVSEGFTAEGEEMCALVYCNEGGTYVPTVTVYDLAVDPETTKPARIEDLLTRYGAPVGTTSRGELAALIHVDACPAPVGCVGHENGGSRYFFCDDARDWSSAQAKCAEEGGYLASIGSAEENAYLTSKLTGGLWWIGASDAAVEGTWTWSNGDAFGYTNWAGGEPNNWFDEVLGTENCGQLGWFGGGLWNDYWCALPSGYICEVR